MWIPYELGESLVFENKQGKQIEYIVDIFEEEEHESRSKLLNIVQSIYVTLDIGIIQRDNQNFRANIHLGTYKPDGTTNPKLSVVGNWNEYNGGLFYILSDYANGNPLSNLIIRGKTYKDVFIFESANNEPSHSGGKVKKVYYTKEEGFIRFETIDGEIWEKIN